MALSEATLQSGVFPLSAQVDLSTHRHQRCRTPAGPSHNNLSNCSSWDSPGRANPIIIPGQDCLTNT